MRHLSCSIKLHNTTARFVKVALKSILHFVIFIAYGINKIEKKKLDPFLNSRSKVLSSQLRVCLGYSGLRSHWRIIAENALNKNKHYCVGGLRLLVGGLEDTGSSWVELGWSGHLSSCCKQLLLSTLTDWEADRLRNNWRRWMDRWTDFLIFWGAHMKA